jgi:hypothetical protein
VILKTRVHARGESETGAWLVNAGSSRITSNKFRADCLDSVLSQYRRLADMRGF